ncbi:MAG TPA: RluA family pseudouridine synthase [Chloroflexota bacterium]|nr:RluA family pseudouridine synthase [Chloroflexota bacterium]
MTDLRSISVPERLSGRRVDVVAAELLPDVSRSRLHGLLAQGYVRVDGVAVKPSKKVAMGQSLEVELPETEPLRAVPEDIPLDIVYRDRDLAIIDKPAGLVVHPAAGHPTGTLANALAALFPGARDVGSEVRPGVVHRLDKDTSGLMVVALNAAALGSLQKQIAERTADRRYLALAAGRVEPAEGTIEAPIGRDVRDRKRMSVHGIGARPARTSYRVLEYLPGFTLLEARLHTGRTHQIRVHLSALGHPIAGDSTYGGPPLLGLNRQFLHSYRLALTSPSNGERLQFESPLPQDLATALGRIRAGEGEP